MPTTCPQCHHVRPADTRAPHWQCPACGVAYAKAAEAARHPHTHRPVSQRARPESVFPWGKCFAALAIAAGALLSIRHATGDGGIDVPLAMSEQELSHLAGGVKPEEVVIYSATWCGYCTQAKNWMRHNGFAFTECDVEADVRCARELQATGSQGVPVLRVRGKLMMDGFDSEEFVALLQQ